MTAAKLAIAVALISARSAFAQSGVLGGNVTSDSAGMHQLVGAEVSIPALSLTTKANFAGEYRFQGLAAGRYLVVAIAVGYKAVGDSVTVAASGDTFHDFVLFTKVAQLESVVASATSTARKYTSPALNAFEERRKQGVGTFIPEEELRKHDTERLANVLRSRTPGIQFVTVRGVDYAIAGHTTANNGTRVMDNITTMQTIDGVFPTRCYATIYLDGVLNFDYSQDLGPMAINPKTTVPAPPRIDDFPIDHLGGVEYYAGEATLPHGYRSGAGCGVLLLWTRER